MIWKTLIHTFCCPEVISFSVRRGSVRASVQTSCLKELFEAIRRAVQTSESEIGCSTWQPILVDMPGALPAEDTELCKVYTRCSSTHEAWLTGNRLCFPVRLVAADTPHPGKRLLSGLGL